MFEIIDQVYDNQRARRELGWMPRHDVAAALEQISSGSDPRSEHVRHMGEKGYHRTTAV